MNKKELDALVNHKLITEVGFVDDLVKNPEKMEKVEVAELASMGILSQPVMNKVLVEEGMDVLVPILTQADFEEKVKSGKAFKLTNDIILDSCIVIKKGDVCNVDLNGYNIIAGVFAENGGEIKEGDSDSYVFWNKGGELTISGSGMISSQDAKYSIAVWAQGGTTVLNGGSYKNAGEGSDLIYASATGSVVINGGYYEACVKQEGVDGTKNHRAALNVKDADYKKGTAKIEVKGGSFLEFDPMDNVSETAHTNFCAEGYKTELNENVYTVVKA